MKTLSCTLFAAFMLLTACSVDVEEQTPIDDGRTAHTITLYLKGNIERFDTQTRVTTSDWEDGARIYIQYQTSNGLVDGMAIYNQATGEWTVNYYGNITSDQQAKCEVYYFENPISTSMNTVVLNQWTAAYSDTQATYLYKDGTITLKAHFRPLTGRIRFRGTAGYQFSLTGLKWFNNYNITDNTLSGESGKLNLIVERDGYTPYVYAEFSDADARKLLVDCGDEDYALSKNFDAAILETGKSGYIDVPTVDSHNGWQLLDFTQKDFTVTGNGKTVTFKMIKVKPGTFQMGSNSGTDDEKPVHQVTLTDTYFMGETEVTQGLWYAVMGLSPSSDGEGWTSSYGVGDNYPAYYISYEDCQKFLTKLNQMTGQEFRFPTEAEWEFAAKGGTKSQGYTYSGSNTIDNVAWYKENSDSKIHEVKTKTPNELALYDMTGNLWEWCADWKGSYSSSEQTNPTGPSTSSDRVIRGGCWFGSAVNCRVTDRGNGFPSGRGNFLGFRLAL